MPLKINGATSGSVTLAAPATGSDVSLTLPVAGFGKVLQVVFATTTTLVNHTTTTPTDTGLSASITPSSTSSKVLVLIQHSVAIAGAAAAGGGGIRVLRGSTVISSNDAYQTQYLQAAIPAGRSVWNMWARPGWVILDSPNTTSAVTYKTQARVESGTSSETLTTQPGQSQSQIVLIEVGP